MSILVPIEDAKATLIDLCQRVERGEDIVLTLDGRPVGRLAPVEPTAPAPHRRPTGLHRGVVVVHDGFDDPLPDVDERFYCDS